MVSGLDGGVSAGPARGMRSRTWRRSHTYSFIRDAHRAAARGSPLGAGFQPRGEGNGADRSHAGDRREGARTDAALRQRCRPRAVSHHYRRRTPGSSPPTSVAVSRSVPVPPPTVGLNEDGPLRRPLPGRLESHDADPGLDRRDRLRETAGMEPSVSAVAVSRVSTRWGMPAAAVHHDLQMAAGRGLAAGIGMSLRARERSRRSARHPDRYGRGHGRSPARWAHSEIHNRVAPGARRRPGRRPRHFSPARVLGGRHRGADRKRFDRGALIRPIVMRTADRAPSASAGRGLSTRARCKTSMRR